jgi:hypothetical protein
VRTPLSSTVSLHQHSDDYVKFLEHTMFRKAASFILLCLTSVALGREFMGHKVIETPFAIAGGTTVVLPMTDAGAVPAEDGKVKIEVAGPIINISKENSKLAVLTWTFGLTAKIKDIESISVAEVAPTETEIVLVNDQMPKLAKKYWIGSTPPVVVTHEAVPWLFTDDTSTFVFRFVINERGKTPRVLYQPTRFSGEAKAYFRAMIAKINRS